MIGGCTVIIDLMERGPVRRKLMQTMEKTGKSKAEHKYTHKIIFNMYSKEP